ncbi:hypothetical protein AYJ54_05540 [Bradyrhizobium centrolobii]|uniref:Uncharacterized protein n=1 Tax=Bradyrhizobium centrolobii TaxID=1505087 RepID=A0A176Z368_9BRAD|nr:hypothetical protein [Bradyrhizobium centrolobii]OAF15160.1 hypothetical protein AYJ54_05540 [Bradyrhizobium centrolobii]
MVPSTTFLGLRREQINHARRQLLIAWLTVVLDPVAVLVGLLDDQQLVVELIGGRQSPLAEARAVFQDVATDQLKSDFVVAWSLSKQRAS